MSIEGSFRSDKSAHPLHIKGTFGRVVHAPDVVDGEEWNGITKLPLGSPHRPIETTSTFGVAVPEASRRFLVHHVDEVVFPNGNKGFHHRIIVPEGVMLAHTDDKDTIALVTNYRHPIGRYSTELPSGGLEPEETQAFEAASPEEREEILIKAALREFREEVGWSLGASAVGRLISHRGAGTLQGAVGFADQTFNIFHGMGGTQTSQNHDDGEAGMLKTFRVPLDDAAEMIGYEIVDPASSLAVERLNRLYGKTMPSRLRK